MGEMSLSQALEEFQTVEMPARNLASRTRVEYLNDLQGLVNFLHKASVNRVGEISTSHISGYLALLEEQGMSGSTRKRKAITFRAFLSFLYRQNHLSHDLSRKIIIPFSGVSTPRILLQAEYQRLLQVCADNARDTAIITLLLQTGMRLSELTRLTFADMEISDHNQAGSVRVSAGNRRKGRIIPLNSKACLSLEAYMRQRIVLPAAPLFKNRWGKPLGDRGVQKLILNYFRQAQIFGASVHTLRHTFAVHHVARGTSVENLQEVMGHQDIRTTEAYVPLANQVLKREMEEHAL